MRANYRVGLAVAGGLSTLGALAFYQFHRSQASPASPVAARHSTRVARPVADSTAATAVADSTAATAVADTAANCQPQPLHFEPLEVGPELRRYIGTVGGEPATAELSWTRPNLMRGHFYVWRQDSDNQLASKTHRGAALVLALNPELPEHYHNGEWRLTTPVGPVLRGVWVDSTGQRRPFVLHENYEGGVHYAIETLTEVGGKPESGGISGFECSVPQCSRDYLHLLGAVPSAWRRLQAPPLAVRQRELEFEADAESSYTISVRINDFGLLSYQTDYHAMPFGGRRQDGLEGTLINLSTGQPLTVASQLLPDYQPALRRLLAQHLLHDEDFDWINKEEGETWKWQEQESEEAPDTTDAKDLWLQKERAPLSDQLVFTHEGLEVTYWIGSLISGSIMPNPTVLIPYRELRPLVRPGTPLARMLQARGMW